MAQRKELTWRQLRVGVMVAVALVILVIGIFFVSGRTSFFESRYMLKAYFPDAEGLHEGAAAQLAGVPVGNVSRIRLAMDQGPKRSVEVRMRVSRRFENDIRADSVATIETFGLLGESFVNIARGSGSQPPIAPGGEMRTEQQADIQKIEQNANDVLSNMSQLSAKLNGITTQLTHGKGTIGKFIYDATLYNRMNDTVTKLQNMMTKVSQGQGTLGELVSNDTLIRKLNDTVDRANQLMDLIQHGNGTAAKLLNDPSFYNNLNKTIMEAQNLVANINQGSGTLGKLVKDPQLYDRMNQVAGNIDTVTDRMVKGQGSLGMLSTNTALYNNLTDSSQSLREFLDEFRKNPKKYLSVRVHIF